MLIKRDAHYLIVYAKQLISTFLGEKINSCYWADKPVATRAGDSGIKQDVLQYEVIIQLPFLRMHRKYVAGQTRNKA